MKRTIVFLVSVALIGATLSGVAEAKKKKAPPKIEREATAVYDAPAPGVAGVASGGNCGSPNTGCAKFIAAAGETFVSIEIVDAGGQKATGAFAIGETYQGYFCGSTDSPFPVTAGIEYTVWVHSGPAVENPCPGVATSGTVKATFTNYE